jgi:predicted TIM-barrel fold metal-dependent hydrolase
MASSIDNPLLAGELNKAEHPWIDAHSHIWTRDVQRFPLANGSTVDDLAPPSFTAEELLEVAHRSRVGRVVLIQHHRYHGWDNSYLIDAAHRSPEVFRVVGMVDNLASGAARTMEGLLPQRVTGIRITPWVHQEKWLRGEMDAMWRTGAKTGQNLCCLIDAKNLPEVEAMCKRFPDTPVVIDHFARIGVDGEIRTKDVDSLCALAKHRNTTLKISAFYALGKKRPPYLDLSPMIHRVLDAFSVERCMWASDSPYQIDGDNTYEASIELIQDRLDGLSDGDRQWLLRKTAERVFFR